MKAVKQQRPPHQTLLDRFKATLADTHLFDVLVGYFRSSGFYQLYDSEELLLHRMKNKVYINR